MVTQRTLTAAPRLSSLEWQRFETTGALLALLGVFTSFFGLSWDIQWHADVGPDTFWTVPHLFVYAGAALTGFACLAVVLLASQASRRLERPDWIPVLGMFRAPVGFVLAGFGAFGFLTSGVFDQWWHTAFGFDAVLSSPPHVGLFFGNTASMIGCVLIFATGLRMRPLAMAVAIAVTLGFSVPIFVATAFEVNWAIVALALPAFLVPLGMAFAASATRQPAMAFWVAAAFTLFRWAFWFLFPVITKAYADSLGLSLRDFNDGTPQIPLLMPIMAPVSGLVMTGLMVLGQARGWRPQPVMLAAGAVSGVLLYVAYLLGDPFAMALAVPVGAFAAWLGWQLGVVVRHTEGNVAAEGARA